MSEPTPDRDERHVQALAASLKRSLEAGAPAEGLERIVGAAFGEDPHPTVEAKEPALA